MSSSNTLALFDFDKTLVAGDSFRLLSMMAADTLWLKAHAVGLVLAYKAGGLSNARYKARVLEAVWAKQAPAEREALLERLYERLRARAQPAVVGRLHEHLERGHATAVLSASPSFYLRPFVHKWSAEIEAYGASVQFGEDEVRVRGFHGAAKRRCARRLIERRKAEDVWVYTDHFSDLPLLSLANHACLVNPSRRLRRAVRQSGRAFELIRTGA